MTKSLADYTNEELHEELARRRREVENTFEHLPTDTVLGKFVYCTQHLNPHATGWCTVSLRNKRPLKATTIEEAARECQEYGWALYSEVIKEQEHKRVLQETAARPKRTRRK